MVLLTIFAVTAQAWKDHLFAPRGVFNDFAPRGVHNGDLFAPRGSNNGDLALLERLVNELEERLMLEERMTSEERLFGHNAQFGECVTGYTKKKGYVDMVDVFVTFVSDVDSPAPGDVTSEGSCARACAMQLDEFGEDKCAAYTWVIGAQRGVAKYFCLLGNKKEPSNSEDANEDAFCSRNSASDEENKNKCTLTDGTEVEKGWSGMDTGDNSCNSCICGKEAILVCSEIPCTPTMPEMPTVNTPENWAAYWQELAAYWAALGKERAARLARALAAEM